MKKLSAVILFLSAFANQSFSQTPDWSTGVAPILYSKCTYCHHEGGMAPFALMTFDDATSHAGQIEVDITAKIMPPWPPDPNYRHLKDERSLSDDQINTINSWVDGGMPSGDLGQAPPQPTYNGNSMMVDPDQTIQLPTFEPSIVGDVYWRFAEHSDYTETKYLNQVEWVAGNPKIIHHVTLGWDGSGLAYQDDENYPGPGCPRDYGSGIWVHVFATESAGRITSLPPDLGFKIPAGSDYVSDVHYFNNADGESDSSKINVKFCTVPDPRPVTGDKLIYGQTPSILDGPLEIPANTVKTFHFASAPFATDQSLLGLCPHSHLICTSWLIYMVNPNGDTIHMISIPHWNSGWQGAYLFTEVVKAPAGATIYATVTFDNTVNNPANPSNPPVDVVSGNSLLDEMAQCHFWLMDYEPGDENIILDSAFYSSIGVIPAETDYQLSIFPNPAVNNITVQFGEGSYADTYFNIYNPLGEIVMTDHARTFEGKGTIQIDCSDLTSGIYLLEARNGEQLSAKKFVIRK